MGFSITYMAKILPHENMGEISSKKVEVDAPSHDKKSREIRLQNHKFTSK